MSNQLLPCPFCGGEPRLVPEDYEDKHGRPEPHAECDHCDLAIPLHTWNRRAAQPAAGEPVAKPIAYVNYAANGQPFLDWLPGGEDESHALFADPPAAAHGDEAVRKDAEAAYIEMTCQPVLIDGAHHYYLSSERMQAFDRLFSVDVSDAAMHAQGDGGEV